MISPSPGRSFVLSWADPGTPHSPGVNIETACSFMLSGNGLES